MRKANNQTEENIKAQSIDIQNLSVSIIETTGAISGLQQSVRGLEKNAGHMSVAMNNLTQSMVSIQQALAASGMMVAQAPLSYLQIPQRPATFQTVNAVSQQTPLTWV